MCENSDKGTHFFSFSQYGNAHCVTVHTIHNYFTYFSISFVIKVSIKS